MVLGVHRASHSVVFNSACSVNDSSGFIGIQFSVFVWTAKNNLETVMSKRGHLLKTITNICVFKFIPNVWDGA